ncbi:hypothetical protein [Runella slithyformis]|uniref:ASCH domain-containing protein n=1 Tax=Runella slithyformis (strain ATCC 29530 / DSM 19594 / LMG 11500 / NCIMB 11436 / LSU 4) TaxID=761193 RepID=A0A7U4E4U1_RUNSL|nr:hypothetical protein [Runella slithyformis]AEI47649.1 hypothetical protein Runsl_1221 [Runella slithyformis DSM 19594]
MITLYQQLDFSYNWNNKLACSSFTTFRLMNAQKYQVGKKLSVMLQGRHLKDVEIIQIKVLKLEQINPFISYLDSGYSVPEFKQLLKTMYKNKNIDLESASWYLILCREIKPEKTPKKQKVKQPELALS